MTFFNFKGKRNHKAAEIGRAPVDSGCLLVIDPAYLRDVLFKGNEQVKAWYEEAVIGKIDEAQRETWPVHDPRQDGQVALGHLVITGYGDGLYPVSAVYAEDGTLAEISVRFSSPGV